MKKTEFTGMPNCQQCIKKGRLYLKYSIKNNNNKLKEPIDINKVL